MADDELKPIPGYPGYSVTIDGRVWSDNKSHLRGDGWMTPQWRGYPDSKKYLAVHLRKGGTHKWRRVHQLVLEAWREPRPPGMFACHKDDNKANNHLDNLYWGTPKQNAQDAVRSGRHNSARSRKLSEQMVWNIHVLRHQWKMEQDRIALVLGISRRHVWSILHGLRYPEIYQRYHAQNP